MQQRPWCLLSEKSMGYVFKTPTDACSWKPGLVSVRKQSDIQQKTCFWPKHKDKKEVKFQFLWVSTKQYHPLLEWGAVEEVWTITDTLYSVQISSTSQSERKRSNKTLEMLSSVTFPTRLLIYTQLQANSELPSENEGGPQSGFCCEKIREYVRASQSVVGLQLF